ncbi:MAG: hypothetical protein ACI8RD_010444, partial [Bacillariaceae sp.]
GQDIYERCDLYKAGGKENVLCMQKVNLFFSMSTYILSHDTYVNFFFTASQFMCR